MNQPSYLIRSLPIRIRWAGWESDTFTLQRFGWQFVAQEDCCDGTLQLLIKHDGLRVFGRSEKLSLNYYDISRNPEILRSLTLNCDICSELLIHAEIDINKLMPIDCEPTFEPVEIHKLSDLQIFRKVNPNVKKVFLKEPSMAEILNMALQKQAPRQEQIRKELIKREELKELEQENQIFAELRLVA